MDNRAYRHAKHYFFIVDNTVCRAKFEIGDEIENKMEELLEIALLSLATTTTRTTTYVVSGMSILLLQLHMCYKA